MTSIPSAHGPSSKEEMPGAAREPDVPAARQKEWLDDLIGTFDCCGPTRGMSMSRPVGNGKRGFTATPILTREQQRSLDGGSAGEASRSTIGPLNGSRPWEFDDASPETWPDDITYTYATHFKSRTDEQSLHMASALASDALVSGTAMPSDVVQARELLSALARASATLSPAIHSRGRLSCSQVPGLILVQKGRLASTATCKKLQSS